MCICSSQISVPFSVRMYILTYGADRSGDIYEQMHHVFCPWSPAVLTREPSQHRKACSYIHTFHLWYLQQQKAFSGSAHALSWSWHVPFRTLHFQSLFLPHSLQLLCHSNLYHNAVRDNLLPLLLIWQLYLYLMLLRLLPFQGLPYPLQSFCLFRLLTDFCLLLRWQYDFSGCGLCQILLHEVHQSVPVSFQHILQSAVKAFLLHQPKG